MGVIERRTEKIQIKCSACLLDAIVTIGTVPPCLSGTEISALGPLSNEMGKLWGPTKSLNLLV